MRFSVTHARAFIGTNVAVTVTVDRPLEIISAITVTLDGSELDTYQVQPATESYTQDFAAVGDAGPGTNHTVIVTAMDGDGQPHSSTSRWTDVT
ncbi:MAG: hypothetical protein ACR2JE_17005 [Acidobacteriaceae bacterium]